MLLRHLLTRWQDKLLLFGRFLNPGTSQKSAGRRPRKNIPKKRYRVSEESEGDTSCQDYEEEEDEEEDDSSVPDLPMDALQRKRGRPRKHPLRSGTSIRHRMKKRHMLEKRHKCSKCDAAFSIPSRLKEHFRVHSGERPFQCDKCDMKFMRATHLKKHRMIHTGLRPFKCSMCTKTFTNNASLKEHTYTHTGQRPHRCQRCPASFTRRISLQEHLRSHTGETPFACKECDLKFAKKAQLKAHMLYHTGEKPYLCQTCGARFRHNTAFNEHVRIHTGAKPFVCQHCGTAFTCRSTLKKHIRLHTGERPYVCTECGLGFAQRTSLVCHIKKHPGMTLPPKNAAKQGVKSSVCLYPVVGRKKRPAQQPEQVENHRGIESHPADSMPALSSTVDHLLPGSSDKSISDHRLGSVVRDGTRSIDSNQQHRGTSVTMSDNMSTLPTTQSTSGSSYTHPNQHQQDSAHLRIPERTLHLEDHAHHLPMSSAWSHDISQVSSFSYEQGASHRGHQVATQPFPSFLSMSSQMPPAFPDQQRFPLDYRFTMN